MKYDMDKTSDFFHEYFRCCRSHPARPGDASSGCANCPLHTLGDDCISPEFLMRDDVREALQKWSDENGEKTRLSEFEKNVPDWEDMLSVCTYQGKSFPTRKNCYLYMCDECEKFWNEVI